MLFRILTFIAFYLWLSLYPGVKDVALGADCPTCGQATAPLSADQTVIIKSLNATSELSPSSFKKCSNDVQEHELNSPSLEQFRKLLAAGADAPLKDFLILWQPISQNADPKNYFDDCEESGQEAAPIKSKDGQIVEECKPDVLYSWGPLPKIENLKRTMGDEGKWKGRPNPGISNGWVWATLSPVSTYGYGRFPIRIKLKPSVTFSTNAASASNVKFAKKGVLNDFIISNAETIESWSYGTPEHYDEIVRDLQRLFSGKRFVGYYRSKSYTRDPLTDITVPEGGFATEKELKKSLLEMIRMILNREGRVFYAPEVCKNRIQHFSTNRPTYFKGL